MNTALNLEFRDFNTQRAESILPYIITKQHFGTASHLIFFGTVDIPQNKVVPIWEIKSAQHTYKLPRPISITINKHQDIFMAENENLSVYGCGESSTEAIEELKERIAHFVEYYASLPEEKVTGEASRLKHLFKQIIS